MRGINEQSIVESAIAEAEAAERHAGLAQSAGTIGSMKSHAEHTVNIIEGTQVDYNENGRPENPGFGVGVLPLLGEIENDINELATAPDASTTLQSNIEFMRVCVVNAREDAERIVTLEQDMLAADSIDAIEEEASESTKLAREVIEGADINGNGQIDPFEGECALSQIEQFSLLMGTANIVEATTTPRVTPPNPTSAQSSCALAGADAVYLTPNLPCVVLPHRLPACPHPATHCHCQPSRRQFRPR